MSLLLWAHVAAGTLALAAGALAAGARKGGRLHAAAGRWFAASMLALGLSAAALAGLGGQAGLGMGGLLTCYFVATGWMTARRRDGTAGRFEIAACLAVLAGAAATLWRALGGAATPAGPGPLFVFAVICLLAGLLDLRAIRFGLTPAQRLSRHLWRMCLAFFIATGSFFIGQQDVLPEAVRGSPALFALGFAPLALMACWLARLRLGGGAGGLGRRASLEEPAAGAAQ